MAATQPRSSPDDAELVRRVQRGEAAAFDELVERYLVTARILAIRVLNNAHDAEDLVQDAFLRALRSVGSVDAARGFGPWFKRLVINLGLNARAARALRIVEDTADDITSREVPPDIAAERSELREAFARAVADLSPQQRLVVMMYEVDGFPTREIAEYLEVTQETVRWHLHEARKRLRTALHPYRPSPRG